MRRIRGYIQLIRPVNCLMIGFAVIIGEIIGVRGFPDLNNVVLGFLTGFFVSASAMVLNDVFDVEIDSVNEPQRPIPSGIVTTTEAKVLGGGLGMLGCILALLLGGVPFLIAIVFWVIAILYDRFGKYLGLLGNAMVSASVAIPYIFGGIVVKELTIVIIILALMSFLANMGREVVKGIIDLEGDRLINARTLAITRGVKTATYVSMLFIIVAILMSPIPFLTGDFGIHYLIGVIIADFLMIYSLIILARGHSKNEFKKAKTMILLGMLLGLLAFLLGGLVK